MSTPSSPNEDRVTVLRIIARMNIGGPAFLVLGLLAGMNEKKYKQILITGQVPGNEREIALDPPGFEILRIKVMSRKIDFLSDLNSLVQIFRLIRAYKPAIIDTHTFKAGFLARIATIPFLWKKPIVIHHYHGHLLHGYFNPWGKKIYVLIERILARLSNVLVVDSGKVASELMKEGIADPDKFKQILPGVNPPIDAVLSPQTIRDSYRVGFVGRLEPIKQPLHYLQVVSLMRNEWEKFEWVMIGEGSLASKINNYIESENLNVMQLPFDSDVYSALSEIDILIMTSLNEGTPLIAMEAAFCGIPTIAYNVGSIDQVVINGETGLICESSPKSVTAALNEMTQDQETYSSFSSSARLYARANFSMRRFVLDHEALYSKLLEESRL